MKRVFFLGMITCLLFVSSTVKGGEIIDSKTVYSPGINICVSSFGGFIKSSEVLIIPGAKPRVSASKKLLLRWIYESNHPGFYLQEFDTSHFYWQFVETRKYIGAVLMVTGTKIHEDFYTSLGCGLNIPGRNFYGLRIPQEINGDLYSFVLNKETLCLDHFENWKFTEESDKVIQMSKRQSRSLVSKKELVFLQGIAYHMTVADQVRYRGV